MITKEIVEQNKKELKRLWKLACEFDEIDPDSSFATFSKDNPYPFQRDQKRINHNGCFFPGYCTLRAIEYLEQHGYIDKKHYDCWVFYSDENIKVYNGDHYIVIEKDGKKLDIRTLPISQTL